MFKTVLNYLRKRFNRKQTTEVCTPLNQVCDDEPSVPIIDLDKTASGLAEFLCSASYDVDKSVVENLDQKHFDLLAEEKDPLERATKIPEDSVLSGKADIQQNALKEPRNLKVESEIIDRPDCIKQCFKKSVDSQTFDMGDPFRHSVPVLRRKTQRGK